ncbi:MULTISPECIES: TRAP transporter large permease [unclassified Shinella]|uniref:TRAP transporter large permease n=1 Tax=unclassified Shinella TaxID=2643062 RepID=UPI00234F2650|nr:MULTISPECIES: TRAP transporter large permease [unclassified Shinella]MCO5149054.1 TRAP transporter large permease [Shinella sp.]MDC7265111.1 TRAP transporter large permease [Shinella sp. HY16]MDC7272008.1 TRAP transporter large permease [Shinella sp. YZ44]
MIATASFVGLIAVGMPIAFALAALAMIYIFTSGNTVLLQSYGQQMFGGLENYGLLALPLFILLGEFMNAGGIGRRLMGLALALLRPLRGGLAYVNLVANMMMASILGSTVAQITIMSRLAVPEMERNGYPRDVSMAITAAGGLLAPIIPPSMLFIIFGVIAQIPIGDLFIAGIVPGFLIFFAFIAVIAWLGHRHRFPMTPPMPMRARLAAVKDALPAALIPIIIVGSILGGIATPTESAAVASLAAIAIGMFVYRELDAKDILPAFANAAKGAASVLFLIAAAQVFSWVITFENLPAMVAESMQAMTSSPTIFLLLLCALLLVVGMITDPIPAIILIVPVFLPVATNVYGIDPFHFGIIVCLNLTLGLLTPPVGTGLFVASLMGNVRAERLSVLLLPFFAAVLVVLALLVFFPVLSIGLKELL